MPSPPTVALVPDPSSNGSYLLVGSGGIVIAKVRVPTVRGTSAALPIVPVTLPAVPAPSASATSLQPIILPLAHNNPGDEPVNFELNMNRELNLTSITRDRISRH